MAVFREVLKLTELPDDRLAQKASRTGKSWDIMGLRDRQQIGPNPTRSTALSQIGPINGG